MKRYIAALVVLITVFASTVWSDGVPDGKENTVKVYALIHINRQRSFMFFTTPPDEASKEAFEAYVQDQKALIKSRRVLDIALADPGVRVLEMAKKANAIASLRRNLVVDSLEAPTVIRISLTGTRPPDLVKIVNAVTTAYLDEVVNKERKTKLERLDTLKILLTKYEERILGRRQQMRDLASAAGQDRVRSTPEARQAHRAALYTEQRDLKRELLRLRLAEAREKVHLAGASDKQDMHKRELAILKAQMDVVRDGLAKVDLEVNQLDKGTLLVADLASDIQRWEDVARKISSEIDRLEVERLAPDRVQLLQEAEVDGR